MERLKDLQRGAPPPAMPPTGLPPGGPSQPSFARRPKRKRSFSTLPWSDYFSERNMVEAGDKKFCTYTSSGQGPTVLCLHGGGHSALSWAIFTAELAKKANVRVLAVDQRGHGDTTTPDDSDLSAETLTADVVELWSALYPAPEDRPPLILLGHSMGGAVAVRIAGGQLLPNIRGVVVIDVVEGSAMEALSAMQGLLKRRPQQFETVDKAVEWSLKSGQLRNSESARVSVGGQLQALREGEIISGPVQGSTVLHEEVGEEKTEQRGGGYTWRVDLSKSEQYWEGWYSGMSKMFLSTTAPKLLLLAGPDRLDTELTTAHMQGKFQLQMFNHAGHSVQEDLPDQVADVVAVFLQRQKIVSCQHSAEHLSLLFGVEKR